MSEEAAKPGPGGVLRATRESLRYTQQDVADALNLSVRVVEDLENEQWQKFHATTFARGYVRGYAKLLSLDPDVLLRDYDGFRQPEAAVTPGSNMSSLFESRTWRLTDAFQRQPGAVLSGAVVLAVCAIAIALVLVWPADPEPAAVAPKTPAALSMPPPASHGAEASAVRPARDAAGSPDEMGGAASADAVPIPGLSNESALEPIVGAFEPAPETGPVVAASTLPARRVTALGDDRLEFSFTDDCWVEVKDESGRNLYSDLSRAGATLSLVGAAPFRILLGYGPAATLMFNGEAVPLAPHTRSNVTSLVLGARSSNR